MITGYFWSDIQKSKGQFKQVKKVAGLILSSNMLYFIWTVILRIRSGTLIDYLKVFQSVSSMWERKVQTGALVSGHLWYLTALLIVIGLVILADKYHIRQRLYVLIPILYIAGLLLGKYSFLIMKNEISIVYSRNFLFTGLCFFLVGNFLRENKNTRWVAWIAKRKTIFFIGSLILILLEVTVLHNVSTSRGDMNISTLLLAVSSFLFFSGMDTCDSLVLRYMGIVGRKYSTFIYLFHYWLISVLNMLLDKLNYTRVLAYNLMPIVVFLLSLIVAVSWNHYHERIRNVEQ